MRISKTVTVLAAALFITTISEVTVAQGFGEGYRGYRRHGDKIEMLIDKLDLSQMQIDKLREMEKEKKDSMKAQREELMQLHKEMKTQWKKDEPNKKTIINLHKKIHRLRGEMTLKHIDMRFSIMEILTPKQCEQFRELMQQKRKNRDGKRGRHRGRF